MKWLLPSVTLALFCLLRSAGAQVGAPVFPEHPATVEQVKRMMAVSHSVDRMQDGMRKMMLQQKQSAPFLPEAFWDDLLAELMKVDWVSVATPIYQKYVSAEDAEKAIAFYSTPAGQHALDSATAVGTEMSAKGFEIGKEAGQRLALKYQKEIQENVRKMQAAPAPATTAPDAPK